MKIYKMTATFGKLRHAELTLEPGLNIIEAPNEWGKSTWCKDLQGFLQIFSRIRPRFKSAHPLIQIIISERIGKS